MAKKQVLLEAIAATSGAHQLLLKRRCVKAHWPLQQWVQVLKRNRLWMPNMNGAEHVERRPALARVADPLEITVKINRGRHCPFNPSICHPVGKQHDTASASPRNAWLDLYAGGYFTTAGGSAANYIAKWNGTNWSALGSGMSGSIPHVYALGVSGSDLYAGGAFRTAGGNAPNRIAKWDGNGWSALGSGMAGWVYSLAVLGNDLYVGGFFATVGGKVSAYVARAYLLPLPALSVVRSGPEIMVSWPSVDTAAFALEQASTLANPVSWVTNNASITDDGTNKSATIPATNSPQFFHLRRP